MRIKGISLLSDSDLEDLAKAAVLRKDGERNDDCSLCMSRVICTGCPGSRIKDADYVDWGLMSICVVYVQIPNKTERIIYAKKILLRCKREQAIRRKREGAIS